MNLAKLLSSMNFFDDSTTVIRTEAMIGDTNLYLSERDGVNVAEIGIMIAENHHRLGGKGTEALSLLLRYGKLIYERMNFFVEIFI